MPDLHCDLPDHLDGLFPNPEPGSDAQESGHWLLVLITVRRSDAGADRPVATSSPPRPAVAADSHHVFQRRGQLREIRIDGERLAVRDRKGHRYIEHLLRQPGTPIAAVTLCAAEAGADARVFAGSRGEVASAQSLGELRRRAAELDEELAEARSRQDAARQEAIRSELAWIADSVRAATTLGGGLRRNRDAERVRVAVTNAVHRAISAIGEVAPTAAAYFRRTVSTGAWLLFRPQGDERWEVDP